MEDITNKKECDCYYTKFCKSTQLEPDQYCRDLKDNTIIIKKKEEILYTKQELINLLDWIKDGNAYHDTNGCSEWKIPYITEKGSEAVINRWISFKEILKK